MATKSLKNKESDIQNSICEYLEGRDRCFFRLNNIPAFNKGAGGKITMRRLPKYTPKGLPDIIVVVGGLFYALEVKKPKTETSAKTYQSKDQKVFQARVEAHSGKYFVVRSLEDVKAIGL
jgi:hypothetical protein